MTRSRTRAKESKSIQAIGRSCACSRGCSTEEGQSVAQSDLAPAETAYAAQLYPGCCTRLVQSEASHTSQPTAAVSGSRVDKVVPVGPRAPDLEGCRKPWMSARARPVNVVHQMNTARGPIPGRYMAGWNSLRNIGRDCRVVAYRGEAILPLSGGGDSSHGQ